jgi:hypothetical protein
VIFHLWKVEFDAILRLIVPDGTRAAYLENEDTKALLEALMVLDRVCIEEKILKPRGGQYLMRPKAVDEVSAGGTTHGYSAHVD